MASPAAIGAESDTAVVAADRWFTTGVPPLGVAVGAPGADGDCVSIETLSAVDGAVEDPPKDCADVMLHAPSERLGSEHPPVEAVAVKVHDSVCPPFVAVTVTSAPATKPLTSTRGELSEVS